MALPKQVMPSLREAASTVRAWWFAALAQPKSSSEPSNCRTCDACAAPARDAAPATARQESATTDSATERHCRPGDAADTDHLTERHGMTRSAGWRQGGRWSVT